MLEITSVKIAYSKKQKQVLKLMSKMKQFEDKWEKRKKENLKLTEKRSRLCLKNKAVFPVEE